VACERVKPTYLKQQVLNIFIICFKNLDQSMFQSLNF